MINTQRNKSKVNLKPIFNDILEVDLGQSDISVCLASLISNGKKLKFEKLQLKDSLAEDFKSVVKKNFRRLKKDNDDDDLLIYPYEAGSKLDSHEVEYMNLSNYNFLQVQIALLSALPDMDIFAGDNHFLAGLKFYVLVIQEQGEPIYCFRKYSRKKELSRSKGIAGLLIDNYFCRVKTPLLLFDDYIDCISRGNDLFILRKGNFHRVFNFFDMIFETAEVTLKKIRTQIDIVNFNEFEQACKNHIQMMSKLKTISSKPYLNQLTISNMKKVINKYNMSIEIIKQNGRDKLVFDPSNKWELLRLLDDDYLESLMTNQCYEVSGKRIYQ